MDPDHVTSRLRLNEDLKLTEIEVMIFSGFVISISYVTGDPRTSEQAGLAGIHTVLHKFHNLIAGGLAEINPHWNDETLYQEARKILIGVWQNIVYTEFLPALLGPKIMRKYKLGIKVFVRQFETKQCYFSVMSP